MIMLMMMFKSTVSSSHSLSLLSLDDSKAARPSCKVDKSNKPSARDFFTISPAKNKAKLQFQSFHVSDSSPIYNSVNEAFTRIVIFNNNLYKFFVLIYYRLNGLFPFTVILK